MASWNDTEITNRATMTVAFNPVSQLLYMKYGMYPREPAYCVEALSKNITDGREQVHDLDFEGLTSLTQASGILEEMDELVLGFSLEWHHEYFFETMARCYVFKKKGGPVGYAYITPSGRAGPTITPDLCLKQRSNSPQVRMSNESGTECQAQIRTL